MIEIHLDSIGNIRDLGDYQTSDGKTIRPNKLIRSAHLGRASREDLDYLKEKHGLSTVIDLRTYKEKEEVPDQTDTLVYRHIPIIEGFEDGITHEKKKTFKMPSLKDTYVELVTKEEYIKGFRKALNLIIDQSGKEGAVLWHYSEGKDRCGMVSVLVLTMLGVDEETIRSDYLFTNKVNVPKAKALYERLKNEVGEEIAMAAYKAFVADEEYLDAALDNMGDDFIEKTLGITHDRVEEFKRNILI